MNLKDDPYKTFALVQEMLETPGILGRFDFNRCREAAAEIRQAGRLFLTGEGSSRIFPAKNLRYEVMKLGLPLAVATEGARQAHEYNLAPFAVFGASNSGQTKELISLFAHLRQQGHPRRYGLTANQNTRLASVSTRCYTLSCGKERAVAATKSVVEQALVYRSLTLAYEEDHSPLAACQAAAAQQAKEVLEAAIDRRIVEAVAGAGTIYFAGRNNGVAEELTLKTNEITRKKSDYLEGTYAVHGVEEVMDRGDVVVLIDPFPEEASKFKEVLVDGVGLQVIAISSQPTIFPTIPVPPVEGYQTVLELLAGWNLLVHVGVALKIDLDHPQRARKIGNEFLG
jgi:glucosamine--fructose-6-phosphate aminotransferase (isomerizing)